jgi:hypothetical protein
MAESTRERTARLLAEGLELFGRDRVQEAVTRWREVLALDPANREARDYLESAGIKAPPAAERQAVAQGLECAARGELQRALALLAPASERATEDLEAQAAYDLVRAQLYTKYRTRIGDGGGRPRLKVAADQLLEHDLPPQAGFLLSMLDGRTPIGELMNLSGLDGFELLHLLARLEKAGIVEILR